MIVAILGETPALSLLRDQDPGLYATLEEEGIQNTFKKETIDASFPHFLKRASSKVFTGDQKTDMNQ